MELITALASFGWLMEVHTVAFAEPPSFLLLAGAVQSSAVTTHLNSGQKKQEQANDDQERVP